MSELELRLTSLGREIAYPPTPALVAAIDLRERSSRPRRLVVALALALVLVAGALALSPGARSAFLELFRLQGATVTRVEALPEVDLVDLDLGERVSREEAERRAGFELVDLGTPDAIHLRSERLVSLVYGRVERPRLVLSQLRGSVWEGFHGKMVGSGTIVEEVEIAGERGLWISGDEHFVMFRDELGQVTDEPTALAGNTLLWNRGPLLLRLEADVVRDEALELAESVG